MADEMGQLLAAATVGGKVALTVVTWACNLVELTEDYWEMTMVDEMAALMGGSSAGMMDNLSVELKDE